MAHVLQAYLLALQPRPAPRRAGAPGARARRRRCRRTSASACTSPRSRRVLDRRLRGRQAHASASCCAASRATRSRCRWRTRSTTSPATSHAHAASASRRCCRRGRATCRATTPCSRCTPSASRRCGDYDRAEASARAALALNPLDARAHHVDGACVRDDRPRRRPACAGSPTTPRAGRATPSSRRIAGGIAACSTSRSAGPTRALRLYDHHVRAGRSDDGRRPDRRFGAALAHRARRLRHRRRAGSSSPTPGRRTSTTRFCSFNDLHAMLAFVGARDWARAPTASSAPCGAAQSLPTRHGATTRLLGLPACRALIAFGRGDDMLAITLLASLPPQAHRLGGSHAQRDVLHLTMRARSSACAKRRAGRAASPRRSRSRSRSETARAAVARIAHRRSATVPIGSLEHATAGKPPRRRRL